MNGLTYHAPTKQFTITPGTLDQVASHLRFAIKHIRLQAGLPLTSHAGAAAMDSPQHAEKALLDLASELGIDLGSTRPGRLDVTDSN